MSRVKSTREHISELHEKGAAFHKGMSGCHDRLAACYSSMSKAAGDDGEMYAKLQAEHSAMSDLHNSAGEYHESCQKVIGNEMNKIVPDGVRGTIPSDTPVTPILRNGQPDMRKVDTSNIPVQFQHLVKVSDNPDE